MWVFSVKSETLPVKISGANSVFTGIISSPPENYIHHVFVLKEFLWVPSVLQSNGNLKTFLQCSLVNPTFCLSVQIITMVVLLVTRFLIRKNTELKVQY